MHKLAILLLAASTGCATFVAPKTDVLTVTSNPPGAEVRANGVPIGRAPNRFEVDRSRPPTVDVVLPGYAPQPCRMRTTAGTPYVVADVVWCVVLFPIGCVAFIDAAGAWNELDTPTCNVTFNPGAPLGAPQPYAPEGSPPQGYPPPAQQPYPPAPQGSPPQQGYPPPPSYPPPPAPQ